MSKQELIEALQKTIDKVHDKSGGGPEHLVIFGVFAGLSKEELKALNWRDMKDFHSVNDYIDAYFERLQTNKGEK